ncbi:hypothetical protein BDV06DRAFT_217110 [Aspergillus oleicola]
MSHQTAPKQNLQKKQISKQEYSFREEWAPETVNDYQLSHDEPAQYQHQHYQQQPPQQFHPHLQPHPHPHPPPHFQGQPQVVYPKRTSMQARIPNKRNQARSSSLFEEWKAKALRSPDKEKTTEADAPLVAANAPKTNRGRGRTGKSTVSGDVRVLLGEHSDNTVNIRSKTKESSVSIGLAVVPKEDNGQVEEPAFTPIVDHEAATKNNPVRRGRPDRQRCEWERQDTRGRQRSLERQELYRGRSLERKPYTAPNGTLLGADELRKLALGTILKGTDKVYFIPCFIEDPWRGLTPVPSIRPSNLMSRF